VIAVEVPNDEPPNDEVDKEQEEDDVMSVLVQKKTQKKHKIRKYGIK
jgi:hypothetical protein